MEKQRYYSNNIGPIKENEIKTIKKGFEISKSINDLDEIIFLIHTKVNTGYFERTFGNENVNALFKGTFIAYEDGPRVKIETIRTISDDSSRKVIIAFGLTSKELFEFDGYLSVLAMIGHQWANNDLIDWAKTWGAYEILSETYIEKYPLPDKVVRNAFKDLTHTVNLTTGIHHPMDEYECKTYLRALHEYGFLMNEKEVFAYLVREKGWIPKFALDVIDLISKLNTGGIFKGGSNTGLKHYIKKWSSDL